MKQSLKASCMIIALALILFGCAGPTCYDVKRPNGQAVCIQQCKPIIEYQGSNFSIKGINIPIPTTGTTVNIGDTAWNKSVLQSAATTSQIMDMQRLSRCERMSVIVSSITDQKEYESLLKKIYENEEKIDQLALLITLNNPEAVVNWINTYSTAVSYDNLDKALEDQHSGKAKSLVRSLNHPVFVPKDTKVRSIDNFIQ
jgi:hypothetical protein